MFESKLFEAALAIQRPWFIKDVEFNVDAKRLDIYIDFKHGSTFPSGKSNNTKEYKVKDTLDSHLLPYLGLINC